MRFLEKLKILETLEKYDIKYEKIIDALTPLNVPWDIETELNPEERVKYK